MSTNWLVFISYLVINNISLEADSNQYVFQIEKHLIMFCVLEGPATLSTHKSYDKYTWYFLILALVIDGIEVPISKNKVADRIDYAF